jgi:hypothetical protein
MKITSEEIKENFRQELNTGSLISGIDISGKFFKCSETKSMGPDKHWHSRTHCGHKNEEGRIVVCCDDWEDTDQAVNFAIQSMQAGGNQYNRPR